MIYIDSSVALARLLFESRSPPDSFWREPLISSRLLEFEVWNRIHAYGLSGSHANDTRTLLAGVEMVEMERRVLAKALGPLAVPLRTVDALHLATLDFVRGVADDVELASYDIRLVAAAQALGLSVAVL